MRRRVICKQRCRADAFNLASPSTGNHRLSGRTKWHRAVDCVAKACSTRELDHDRAFGEKVLSARTVIQGSDERSEYFGRNHDGEIEMFRCRLPAESSGGRYLLQPPLPRDAQLAQRNAGGGIDDGAQLRRVCMCGRSADDDRVNRADPFPQSTAPAGLKP